VRFNHVASFIVNANYSIVSAAETAGPLVHESAQEAEKGCGQPTLKLNIAKFLEARTSDLIEPLHGN
jgi:hypothetical protein